MSSEKKVSYQISNTYSVLNTYSEKTKNVWLVCHGLGYLSRYFLRHFKHLDAEKNYVIAPQAQAKYYQNEQFTHIGASWLTRENKEIEIRNVLNYLDEVYNAENLKKAPNLIVLGFSQGVSIATRWVAKRQIECRKLVMCSGKVPEELRAEDFQFLNDTQFSFLYGNEDKYLNKEIVKIEEKRLHQIFPENFEITRFKGGHELNKKLLADIGEN